MQFAKVGPVESRVASGPLALQRIIGGLIASAVASLGGAAAGFGRALHARDSDALGTPQSWFCLVVLRAADLCVSCHLHVVADSVAVRARPANDWPGVEWIPAAPGVSPRYRPCAVFCPNQRCDAL